MRHNKQIVPSRPKSSAVPLREVRESTNALDTRTVVRTADGSPALVGPRGLIRVRALDWDEV